MVLGRLDNGHKRDADLKAYLECSLFLHPWLVLGVDLFLGSFRCVWLEEGHGRRQGESQTRCNASWARHVTVRH